MILDKRVINNIDQINAVWYRKFGWFSRSSYFHSIKDQINFLDQRQLANEYNSVLGSIISLFKRKKWLTPPWLGAVNKLDILHIANEFGIQTPQTWILTNKKQLLKLKNKNISLISKSVFEPYFKQVKNGYYSMFTKQIKNIRSLPDNFFPSLVQEKIIKEYEIRSFYLNGKFYSMAIFSQSNKKSSMDFRRYDFTNPNRRVPYNLHGEIKDKLIKM